MRKRKDAQLFIFDNKHYLLSEIIHLYIIMTILILQLDIKFHKITIYAGYINIVHNTIHIRIYAMDKMDKINYKVILIKNRYLFYNI